MRFWGTLERLDRRVFGEDVYELRPMRRPFRFLRWRVGRRRSGARHTTEPTE